MIGAGELKARVEIQTREQTPDGVTGLVDAYTTTETVWAKVVTLKGTPRIDTVNTGTGPTHRFIIRSGATIDARYFLLYDGRRFEVLDVENQDELGIFLDCLTREKGDS